MDNHTEENLPNLIKESKYYIHKKKKKKKE